MDVNMNPGLVTEGTHVPDQLSGGDYPVATDTVTIKQGEVRLRGAVLGKITATGKYILSASAAVDGSQNPTVVLLQDVDATAADQLAPVLTSGEVNEYALILGAGHTVASIKDALRLLSIYIKKTVRR